MVDRMLPAPEVVGREGEHPGDETANIVGSLRFEERTVATVVVDDEHPHQKAARQDRQRQGDPIRHRQAAVRQNPKHAIGNKRVKDLENTAPKRGLLVPGHDFPPGQRVDRLLTWGRN